MTWLTELELKSKRITLELVVGQMLGLICDSYYILAEL